VDGATYEQLRGFVSAWGMTQPRLAALCMVLPWFGRNAMPATMRLSLAAGLGLVVAPAMLPSVGSLPGGAAALPWLGKELMLGALLGWGLALPLWAFEAAGFFIDNQRGASISATLDPLTGNDSSPLGELFGLAFATFVLVSGGFALMLDLVYRSFELWPVLRWTPTLAPAATTEWLGFLDTLVRTALLLSAPVIVAMFLAELGLALVSRFAPQLQVFFLAMGIKSGIALLVLVAYAATLFSLGQEGLRTHLATWLPFLQRAI